jgi:hypothetical protein
MYQPIRLTFHTDPGHGWLEVHRGVLEKSGIADKVSEYSYMRGDIAYLEEDRDAGLFLNVLDEIGIKYSFDERHTNEEHWIRRLPCYKYRRSVDAILTSIFQGANA